jgi:hypothetical protein
MARFGGKLAKLSKPRIHGAVARERLFAWIDVQVETPVIRIIGPAGAGRTTTAVPPNIPGDGNGE